MKERAELMYFSASALLLCPVPFSQRLIACNRQLWGQPPDHSGRRAELQHLPTTELGAAFADGPYTTCVPSPVAWREHIHFITSTDLKTKAEPFFFPHPPGHHWPPAESEQRPREHQPRIHPRRLYWPFRRGPGYRHRIINWWVRLQPSRQQWTLVRDDEQLVSDITTVTQFPGVWGRCSEEVQ